MNTKPSLPQMKEWQAYSILYPIMIIGAILMVSNALDPKVNDITMIGKIGILLVLSGTLLFFYHLYTIVTEINTKGEKC